mgnify:CR=1 FL=1
MKIHESNKFRQEAQVILDKTIGDRHCDILYEALGRSVTFNRGHTMVGLKLILFRQFSQNYYHSYGRLPFIPKTIHDET